MKKILLLLCFAYGLYGYGQCVTTVTVSTSLEAFLEAELSGTLLDDGGNDVTGFSDGTAANNLVCQNAVAQVATLDAEVAGALNISDFTGIEHLTALEILEARGNALTQTTVDLSNNSALTRIDLQNTGLSNITLPNNNQITRLDVARNGNLTSIDLSESRNLQTFLSFEGGLQGNLDLTNNNALGLLGVENCDISSITWPTMSSLFKLSLRGNQLTQLDLRAIDSRNIDVLLTCGNPLTCIQVNDITDANTKLETDLIDGTQCPPRTDAYPNEDPDGTAEWRIEAGVSFTTGNSCTNPATPDDFIITVRTDNPGTSNDDQFLLPLFAGETYDFAIDWDNDGIIDEPSVTAQPPAHTYPSAGTYTIVIKDNVGDGSGFPRIFFDADQGPPDDAEKLLSVDQWGTFLWSSMGSAFQGCSNMDVTATDRPDLSVVTNLNSMFERCTSFNGDISSWDVSNVTNLSATFEQCTSFNADIGSWNVSGVTTMRDMLNGATSFNQNLGNWDITSATNMTEMLNNSGLDTDAYDNTLIGWAALPTVPNNITLGAVGLTYCNSEVQRQSLIDNNGWTFNGDARDIGCDITATLTATQANALEDGPVDGEFTVTLSSPVPAGCCPLTVNYSVLPSSTAVADDDYTALTGTVDIPIGSDSAVIPVAVIDNDDADDTETVVVTLEAGTDYVLGTDIEDTVTITNDFEADNITPDVSANTFRVTVLENSCVGQTNGAIELSVNNTVDTFNVVFNGQNEGTISQGQQRLLSNELAPGEYVLTLTAVGFDDWEQEFRLQVGGVQPISVQGFSIDQDNLLARLRLEGSESYVINTNGKEEVFKGFDASTTAFLEIPLEKGVNRLVIQGEKACQGLIEKQWVVGTVLVHPVPVNDWVNVEGLPPDVPLQLRVYDVLGRLVSERSLENAPTQFEMDLGNLGQGMYLFKITGEGFQKEVQLLKN